MLRLPSVGPNQTKQGEQVSEHGVMEPSVCVRGTPNPQNGEEGVPLGRNDLSQILE